LYAGSVSERGVVEAYINLREGFDKGKRRTSRNKKAKKRLDIVFWKSQIKFGLNIIFVNL
jgi:hypothetical protein